MDDDQLQRTDEWHQRRLGKVTASRIADMLAQTKDKKWGAGRKNYMAELLVERLTGQWDEGYQSAAMLRGAEVEDLAIRAYSFRYGVTVERVQFVDHPTITMAGASPDGLVGDDGGIELKCPNTATHIATLRGASIDGGYMKQVYFQMACTGRQWIDFISFDPRLPEHLALFVQRIPRDDGIINTINSEVEIFLRELDEMQAELARLYPDD